MPLLSYIDIFDKYIVFIFYDGIREMHNSNYLFTFFSNIELIIFAIIIFYFILKKEYEKVRIFGILSIGIIAMFFL
jgi:hypothetical protein